MTTTQWGRKETIVHPQHAPIYSYGAAFLALVFTGVYLYLYMTVAMTPLGRWYIPLYVRTGVVGMPGCCERSSIRHAAKSPRVLRCWNYRAGSPRLPTRKNA